ncbi:response regulator [Paenibacillus chartarius]|uniref:Response regulator n=1 Tax=Paenibacillus chartarius TaxID=747481 RepID=A0ABV6DMD9_9BACL
MTNYLHHQPDILVAGSATNKEEAVRLTQTLSFDVALVDIHLTENRQEGIDAVSEIVHLQPVKVIMLTGQEDEELIIRSFAAGAVNYLYKTRYRDIPAAIRFTYQNAAPIEVLLKDYERLKQDEKLRVLTTAEREIFDLAERGYTLSQIGQVLHKTEQTIKNQTGSLLKKLGARRLREAVETIRKRIR